MTSNPPPIFNEILIRAKCTNDHSSFCAECDDTEYIERWVLIEDLLSHLTLDNMQVNLQWHPPTITE